MTSYGEKEDPCVLWVDAHADINTIKSSESGSMHGMPMSFHIKEIYDQNKNLKHMEWFKPTYVLLFWHESMKIIFGIHLLIYFSNKTSFKHVLLLFLIFNSLTSKNVAYIGLRSVDVEEKEMLEKLNIEVFSMREIDDLGIKEVWDELFIWNYFSGRTTTIYVLIIFFKFIITNK